MLNRIAPLILAIVLPTVLYAAADVTEFTLENGMQAVVIEDHRTPAVVHMVWYRVGAADEAEGHSGVAHFFEHLMFKATDTMDSGEFSRVVEENGGSDNAFTSWDYTAYYQRVAADRLDLMMMMEADRMRGLRLTEEEVATERSVILEERAQRTDSNPGALFNEQMRAALYLNHPYGRPVVGWRHEMEDLSREDALTHYRRHYAPDNAILIVAGDVTPDEVRTLAETYYGPLAPEGFSGQRLRPSEPPQIADRRISMTDPRVSNPYLARLYLAPERNSGEQETAAALSLLAQVLGGSGATSVLSRTLQIDEQRALYASASYDAVSLDPSTFSLVNVPVPGVTLAEAEADMDRVIAGFLRDGIDPEQFERIKFQYAASEIYAQDDVQGLARAYGAALTSGLTVADVQAWPDVIAATTVDDVMAAARMIFEETTSVTGTLALPEAPAVEVSQ